MDFIELVSRTATLFSGKKVIYLHCVDLRAQESIQLDDFPCIEAKVVLGHFSFPQKIAERRMCAFANRQKFLDLLKDRRSPVLIEVLNSCDIKVSVISIVFWEVKITIVGFRSEPRSKLAAIMYLIVHFDASSTLH